MNPRKLVEGLDALRAELAAARSEKGEYGYFRASSAPPPGPPAQR